MNGDDYPWRNELPTKAGIYWMRYVGGDVVCLDIRRMGEPRVDACGNKYAYWGLRAMWHGGGGEWLDKFERIQWEAFAPADPPPYMEPSDHGAFLRSLVREEKP